MRRFVNLVEVGARDGIQGITTKVLTPHTKAAYINLLVNSGIKNIEVGSFVSDSVKQMKTTREVIGLIRRPPDVNFMALIGNRRYAEEAAEYPLNTFAVFTTISETFSQKNNGCDISKNTSRISEIIQVASRAEIKVRGYISCVFGCSYEGYDPVRNVEKTVEMTRKLLDMGCYQISIADTIGTATPETIISTIKGLEDAGIDLGKIAIHLHDPHSLAKSNLLTALKMGIRTVDGATGGIGGCPNVINPSSNIDTLTVVRTLNELRFAHNTDYNKIRKASRYIQARISSTKEDD